MGLSSVEIKRTSLWTLTTWNVKFKNVESFKQPETFKCRSISARDARALSKNGGNVKVLTSQPSNLYTTEELASSNLIEKEVVAIARGGISSIKYYSGKFINSNNYLAISKDTNKLDTKYLYNFLLSRLKLIETFYRDAIIKNLNTNALLEIPIPIPCPDNPKKSLAIQAEIVRILDTFTELTTELTAELKTELTLRKKQYNYYRDQLLSFKEVEWKALGVVAIKISSGGTPKTGVAEYWENGTIPWMSSGEVNLETLYSTEKFITEAGLKNSSAKYVPKNSIVLALAGQGKTRGKVARIRIDLTTNQSLAALTFDESKINPDYVFHFLKTQYENLRQISSGSGTRGGLNLQMISNYKLPIPSLTEQARIVAILDKFDALTNSISEGLPREIQLRQQQYEYYRDLLLNFPKPEEKKYD